MRYGLLTIVGVVLAGASAAPALPPPPPPGSDKVIVTRAEPVKPSKSRMDFRRIRHDFGPMMDNEIHHTTFEFTNTGSDPLEIINIYAECGCTVPELEKKLYMPGESGELKVEFNPEGKVGDLVRVISILSNDGSGGEHSISIAAQVTPIVEIVPRVLTVGVTDRQRPITKLLTVSGRTEDFEVTGARPRSGDEFKVRIIGTEDVTNRFGDKVRRSTLEVTFTPTSRIGDYNAQLEMDTNDPRRATVRAQLIARVHGDLYTKPRNLAVRGARAGTSITRNIRLLTRADKPFKVLGVEISEGNFVGGATFEPVDPENTTEWLISVTATPSVVETRVAQELIIRTDAPDEEVVRIPIRGVVRDAK